MTDVVEWLLTVITNFIKSDAFYNIIFLSGWFFAFIVFGWTVYERVRFRQIVRIHIESIEATDENQSTKYLMVTVRNDGRRPFHAVDIGVLFSKGENYTFFTPYLWAPPTTVATGGYAPPMSWVTPSVWLYRMRPYQYGVSYTILKEEKNKRNADIDKVYVIEETGDIHTWEIPKSIRQELNE